MKKRFSRERLLWDWIFQLLAVAAAIWLACALTGGRLQEKQEPQEPEEPAVIVQMYG